MPKSGSVTSPDRPTTVVYGVHRTTWGRVGEIELLTAQQDRAEGHARHSSADWCYGQVIVTSRKLDDAGCLREISVWKDGAKVRDFGRKGSWRKVRESPI
jgi:hypothetical protein